MQTERILGWLLTDVQRYSKMTDETENKSNYDCTHYWYMGKFEEAIVTYKYILYNFVPCGEWEKYERELENAIGTKEIK